MCSTRCFSLLLCLIALGLAGVSYYTEERLKADPEYKPFCDIDENISCSKAFKSEWGKGFGIMKNIVGEKHWLNQPNPVYAFIIYSFLALLSLCDVSILAKLQLIITVFLNLGSVYLGYILYFVLKNLCVMCVVLYVVNFLLLVTVYIRSRNLAKAKAIVKAKQEEKRKSKQYSLPTTSKKNV